jgi:hypothetical protein
MLASLLTGLVGSLVQSFEVAVAWLLQHTVLSPFTLGYNSVALTAWHVMLAAAWGIAALLVTYECVRFSIQPMTDAANAPAKIFGRAALAMTFAASSYYIADLALRTNNLLVTGILAAMSAGPGQTISTSLFAAANMGLWLLLIVLVAILGLLFACVSWIVRACEIVLLVAIAPVAFAVSIAESGGHALRWWSTEFIAAVFSQSMWALTIVLAVWSFAGGGVHATPATSLLGSMLANAPAEFRVLVTTLMGLGFIYLSFQSQRWLKGMIHGQQASRHQIGAGELAMGYMAARAATGAVAGPQGAEFLARYGLGRASEGAMRAQAAASTRMAGVMAQPEFAVPMAAARANATFEAEANPTSRQAGQRARTMQTLSQANPLEAAAGATRMQATRQVRAQARTSEAGGGPSIPQHDRSAVDAGLAASGAAWTRMHVGNPYTAAPIDVESAPNPYTADPGGRGSGTPDDPFHMPPPGGNQNT